MMYLLSVWRCIMPCGSWNIICMRKLQLTDMRVNTSKKIQCIYVASFLDLFAVSLILPSMSTHLKSLGASQFFIGAMSSIYAFTQLFSAPIIGNWSDKIGRQKIFIATYCIISCCYPLLALINSLYVFLFVRATIGIFKHGQALLQTIVKDQFTVEQQPGIIGHLKSVAGVSFTLGPAIAGHLSEFENGFYYICCCAGALLAINIVIGHLYLADEINRKVQKKRNSFEVNIVQAMRCLANTEWQSVGHVFALKFILDMATGLFHSNYNLKIQSQFNISPRLCGYTIAFQSFMSVMSGLSINYINDRFYKTDADYKRRNIHGFIFMSIAFVGINFTNHLSLFLMWSVVLASSRMFLRVILTDMLMRRSPPNQIGFIAGSATSIASSARLIIPLLAGIVENFWGVDSANVLAAIIAVAGMCISFKIDYNQYEKNPNDLLSAKHN